MALADRYDSFLVDLDGVVFVGDTPVPGAPETLTALTASGKVVRFLTNGPNTRRSEYVDKLGRMGIVARDEHIISACWAIVCYLRDNGYAGKKAYIIGSDTLRDEVRGVGLQVLHEADGMNADAVVLADHISMTYDQLRVGLQAALRGALILGAHRDRLYPMPDGPWPGAGMVVVAVEYGSGRKAVCVGKPEASFVRLALGSIDRPGRVLVVGDRVDTDVASAHAVGIDSALVLTGGVSRAASDAETPAPTHRIGSLKDLLR